MNISLLLISVCSEATSGFIMVEIQPQCTLKEAQSNLMRVGGQVGPLSQDTLHIHQQITFSDGYSQSNHAVLWLKVETNPPVWFTSIPIVLEGDGTRIGTVDPSRKLREDCEDDNTQKLKTTIRGKCQ